MSSTRSGRGADDGSQLVKSADRTLAILEYLGSYSHGVTRGDLARQLDIPKSSLHGLLKTLQERGWVQEDDTGARLKLGLRALLVGASYVDSDQVVDAASDLLDDLAVGTKETVHLGRLEGGDIVYLAKRESAHPLRLYSAVGRRLPAHATALGKAILAERGDAEVARILPDPLPKLTPNTIVDIDALFEELARTRERGYAIDDQENTEGIRCFAVPLQMSRPVRDAISCSVPVIRLEDDRQLDIIEQIKRAKRLSPAGTQGFNSQTSQS